jgi:ribose transport system substrate-binding protein
MYSSSLKRLGPVAALLAAAALAVGCGSSDDGSPAGGGAPSPSAGSERSGGTAVAGDITSLCGEEPVTVAFAKGAGDTWTKITLATLEDEAAKCPNVQDVLFTDARGNQTKGISDINGLVAQGVDVLISMPEFGPAQLPALRSATRAGVTVVTQINDIGANVPDDVAAAVNLDMEAVGVGWAEWLDRTVRSGKVVFLGGIPGAQSSKLLFDAFKGALARYPDLELVVDGVVDTNWNAGQRQRVTAGLLAKHGRLDAVVTDYGSIDYGTLNAFKQANMRMPALATFSASNGLACYWEDNGRFPLYSVDGQTTVIRTSLRKGLAAFNEIDDPEPSVLALRPGNDTSAGMNPRCDRSLPDDAQVGSDLSPDQLKAIFE